MRFPARTKIADHKAQVGRALDGVTFIGIYHDKKEILILRTSTQVIRYFPLEDFKLEFKGKIYHNVTLNDLREIVKTGSINCAN